MQWVAGSPMFSFTKTISTGVEYSSSDQNKISISTKDYDIIICYPCFEVFVFKYTPLIEQASWLFILAYKNSVRTTHR
jgi:hypothetical protein